MFLKALSCTESSQPLADLINQPDVFMCASTLWFLNSILSLSWRLSNWITPPTIVALLKVCCRAKFWSLPATTSLTRSTRLADHQHLIKS